MLLNCFCCVSSPLNFNDAGVRGGWQGRRSLDAEMKKVC
jgi:hypothetical protein